jgi:hypothetical protein
MRDALHLISALKRPSNKGIVAKDATEEEKSFINRMVARLVNLHPTLPTHSTQSVSKTKDHFVKSGTEKGSLHQATIVPTHKEEKSSSHHVQWTTKTHTSHQDLHSQTAWHEESEKHISLRKSSFKGSSHADSAGAGIHGSHKQSNTQRQIEESHVQGDKHVQWSEYEDCSSGNRGRVEHRPTYGKSKVEVVRHYVQEHEKKGHWSSTHQDYKAEGKRTHYSKRTSIHEEDYEYVPKQQPAIELKQQESQPTIVIPQERKPITNIKTVTTTATVTHSQQKATQPVDLQPTASVKPLQPISSKKKTQTSKFSKTQSQ